MEESTPDAFADRDDPTPPFKGRQNASTNDANPRRHGRSVSDFRHSVQDRLVTKYAVPISRLLSGLKSVIASALLTPHQNHATGRSCGKRAR